MPESSPLENSGSNSVVQKLEETLAKAKGMRNPIFLFDVIEDEKFGADPATTDAGNRKIASLVDQALAFIKTLTPTYGSMQCQALIARYYARTGAIDKAIVNYREAIDSLPKTWRNRSRFGLTMYNHPYSSYDFETSCRTALALLFLQKGDKAQAEKQRREINWPNANFMDRERSERFKAHGPLSLTQQGSALLASRLGAAYEASGQYAKALQFYTDMLAFEAAALDPGYSDPRSSNLPIVKWHSDLPQFESDKRINYDKFIGAFPPTEDIVAPYVRFAKAHPRLVKREDAERVEQQLDTMLALRRARASMDKNFDWRVEETRLIGTLRTDPEKGLALLKEEIAARKSVDLADPALASSINLIGYQLMLVGLYPQAEDFLNEAIALREEQGKPGQYALGNSVSNLGLLYLEEGKLTQSRPLLEKALLLRKGDPNDQFAQAKTQISYGRLLAAEGKRVEAKVQLEQAAEVLKGNSPVPEKFTAADFRVPFTLSTLERRAIRAREQSAGGAFYALALIELATLYLSEGNYDGSKAIAMRAMTALSEKSDLALDARVHEKLGRVYTAKGQLDDAENELATAELAIAEHRADGMVAVDILSALGELNTKQEKIKEAREYYGRAADRLAKMLGSQNPRVVSLRKLANS
jgi:tetratricopeptide (TPR) repeat protein